MDEINNILIEENNIDSIDKGNIINEIEGNNSFKISDLHTRILEDKRFKILRK